MFPPYPARPSTRSLACQSRQMKFRSLGVTWMWSCCRSRGQQLDSDPPCGPTRRWPLPGHDPGPPLRADAAGDVVGPLEDGGESRSPRCCGHRVSPWSPCDKALRARGGGVPRHPPCLLPLSQAPLLCLGPAFALSSPRQHHPRPPSRTPAPDAVRCPRVQPRRHLHRAPGRGSPGEPMPGTGARRGLPSRWLFATICWRDGGVGIRACPLQSNASKQD